ncbi:DNA cytosine methyltransferase [Enterovibrio norvegicus]|uniref:DNA cytosine methyltransferase n=1 Tax=Enterovibrio norvegicus TaxID=188144 RepID=UPI00352E5F56
MISLDVNVPDLASKRLKVTEYGNNRRKLQISSNLLPLFGFEKDQRVVERSLGNGKGFVIEPAMTIHNKPKKVYQRSYKSRKNNGLETVTETSRKDLLNDALGNARYVHVTFRHGHITVKPVINKMAERIEKLLKSDDPYSIFAACTSGVDTHAATQEGWSITSILDRRPQESRDKTDKSETGLMTALSNVSPLHAFNEDIYDVSVDYLLWATKNNPATVFTVSPQCCDFSNAKSAKKKHQDEQSLSTTLDMIYPILKMIEGMRFPCILTEEVSNFGSSDIGRFYDIALRRMGYKTTQIKLDARDHGGVTSRVRWFHFATALDAEFSWPEPQPRSTETLWSRFIAADLSNCRDITHTQSMKDGLATGRLRPITSSDTYGKTLLKSNSRQAKDSIVLMDDDRILFPTENIHRELMTVPDDFSLDTVSKEVAIEILGQAVDHSTYRHIMRAVKDHVSSAFQA